MLHILPENLPERGRHTVLSPLMLGDRLIGLAKDADQAGQPAIAVRLIRLACDVLEGGGEDAAAQSTPLPLCGREPAPDSIRGRRAPRGG